jgi:AAA+ ATPase superfamily predicted ATPase
MQFFKDTLSILFRIRPKINVEPTNVSLDFSIDSMNSDDIKTAIEDTMRMLGEFHKKQRLMIFFDEFQKIAEISDNAWLEGTLRSEIQKQQDVPYLFCGSRRGLIVDMFQNRERPFYHMANPIEFPRFNDEFIDWLKKRFTKVHLSISKKIIKYLLDITDWSPNYAQMIAFHLIANPSHNNITNETVDSILNEICSLNTYTYMTLFDSLSSNAQRVLRLAALNPGESPFKYELLQKFQLTNSTVQAALKSLINKRILDDSTSKGKLFFDDPLFLRWIQNTFRY